uniref:Uncharacterized protein n=1 Tax=Arundo donax TaxID=35708 RepID=A0A0A9EHL2_ARUDO
MVSFSLEVAQYHRKDHQIGNYHLMCQ